MAGRSFVPRLLALAGCLGMLLGAGHGQAKRQAAPRSLGILDLDRQGIRLSQEAEDALVEGLRQGLEGWFTLSTPGEDPPHEGPAYRAAPRLEGYSSRYDEATRRWQVTLGLSLTFYSSDPGARALGEASAEASAWDGLSEAEALRKAVEDLSTLIQFKVRTLPGLMLAPRAQGLGLDLEFRAGMALPSQEGLGVGLRVLSARVLGHLRPFASLAWPGGAGREGPLLLTLGCQYDFSRGRLSLSPYSGLGLALPAVADPGFWEGLAYRAEARIQLACLQGPGLRLFVDFGGAYWLGANSAYNSDSGLSLGAGLALML